MNPLKRIGLFGGSFDPVHTGHLAMACDALELADLDRVYFIPTACSPFKEEGARVSDEHRLAMLELALEDLPKCAIDRGDVDAGGMSYSVLTAGRFREHFPRADLFWIMGADILPTVAQWNEAQKLASLVTFLCFERPTYEIDATGLPSWISWRMLRAPLRKISSTDIRAKLRLKGSAGDLLTEKVNHYIHDYTLYL